MDYLELKYPQPALLPNKPWWRIAKMRMVQMVAMNELMPLLPFLIMAHISFSRDKRQKLTPALAFLTEELGTRTLFWREQLNLARAL